MNRSEHLTENQLKDYFGNSALESKEKHAVGRHLLQCDFCLKRLPQPTVEQFWAALMTDENADDFVDDTESLTARLILIVQKLTQPKVLALSGATLTIVLFFSAFIWLGAVKSSEMEKEVAENFETKEMQPVFSQTGNETVILPSARPSVESDSSSPAVSTRIVPDRDLLAAKEIKPKQNTKTASTNGLNAKIKDNSPQKENIALTRGGTTLKCGDHSAIDLEVETNDEKVVLRWKKFPNAAKYHLYISDDEEILIDEYETEKGTSYALIKPLDPVKTYQWKVIITLENGKTVIGDSQKFTVKDLRNNQKKQEKKKSEIRCSAKN